MRVLYFDPPSNNFPLTRKLSFYSASEGYIATNGDGWIGYTSDSGRTFIKRYITFSNVNYNNYTVGLPFLITGVKAFNRDTLLVYGSYNVDPAILRSTDGGQTFTLVFYSPISQSGIGQVADMVFPQNGNTGYAVDEYRILRSTNKGLTWSIVNSSSSPAFGAVKALNSNTVFAYSSETNGTIGTLLKSLNAGVSWQPVSIPNQKILSCEFLSQDRWLINTEDINQNGWIHYTSNGGANWSPKNNIIATPADFSKMSFINESTGFGIAYDYKVYKTTDTGKIWEPFRRETELLFDNGTHNDLFVFNNTQLWAGGWRNLIEINTNAGAAPLPKAFFLIDTSGVSATNTVILKNFSKQNYTYRWFVNGVSTSTNYNSSYQHLSASSLDSVSLIVSSGGISDTLTRYQNFFTPSPFYISSFSPLTGSTGTELSIKGYGFTGSTSVVVGGVPSSSFAIVSDTIIRAIVAGGASGNVTVFKAAASFSKPGFTYFAGPSGLSPVISSISPSFGNAGTAIVINGTNFAADPNSMSVSFGTVKSTITTSSPTQISCIIPYGASYNNVHVLNKNTGLAGTSSKPFSVTFPDSSNFTLRSFKPEISYEYLPSLGSVWYIEASDLDGDGKPDLLLNKSDSLFLLRNNSINGNFAFTQPQSYFKTHQYSTNVSDLDGDGKPDIISGTNIHNPNTNTIVNIYRNKSLPGQFSFDSAYPKVPQMVVEEIRLEDLDGDGRNDLLAVGQKGLTSLAICRNTSTKGFISFGEFKTQPTTGHSSGISVGDIDGDGKKDIVIGSDAPNSTGVMSVYRNTSVVGNISFAARVDFPSTSFAKMLLLCDMDLDGKLDIVAFKVNTVSLYKNVSAVGNISLTPSDFISTNPNFRTAVGNLSGSIRPTLYFGSSADRMYTLKRTIINGSTLDFEPEVLADAGTFVSYPSSADLNLDGKPDLILAGFNLNKFTIYRNIIGVDSIATACAGTQKLLSSDLSGSVYQWQMDSGAGFVNLSDNTTFSGVQTVQLTINNTPILYNGNKLRCVVGGLYSRIFRLQVSQPVTPGIVISTPTTNVCAGAPVTFTATPGNPGTNPTYIWYINLSPVAGVNGNTFTTSTLANNVQIRANLTSNAACASPINVLSNTIQMSVAGTAPTVSISASSTPVCPNSSVTFTSNLTNGGTNPVYQWEINGIPSGINSPTFNPGPLSAGTVVSLKVFVTTACSTQATASSNTITVANGFSSPTVTIITATTTVCAGSGITFSSTVANGGTTPNYQWQVNGVNAGTNISTYTTSTLPNGAQVQVTMTAGSGVCLTTPTASSNIITMTVNPVLTPTITIAGNTTVNAGQSSAITATVTNGGTFPLLTWLDSTNSHTWQTAQIGSNPVNNYIVPHTGAKLKCQLQSNQSCITSPLAMSNILVFTVNTVTSIPPIPGIQFGIRYYPNPVTEILYIDSMRLTDKWETIEISHVGGSRVLFQKVNNRTAVQLFVSHLASGSYIAVLRRKNGAPAYIRFVKM